MSSLPHEPTSPPRSDVSATSDTPPPAPPHELPRELPPPREFEHGGRQWIAWIAGKGAPGTGSYGLGLIEAIHFAAAQSPEEPLSEALLARGRFEGLFDRELGDLLETATPITAGAGRS